MKIFQQHHDCMAQIWATLRVVMGTIFLWAFLDKLFGLGFATCRSAETGMIQNLCEKAWLSGGSPTSGFLMNGTQGPFGGIFESMAGNPIVDWLFMLGLLGIGIALILGIAMKVAGYSGALLMLFMYLATLFPSNHPLFDEHIVYGLLLLGFAQGEIATKCCSISKWWAQTGLVKKYKWLQ